MSFAERQYFLITKCCNSSESGFFTFDTNTTATYLINSSGDLVRRVNQEGGQTSITDDFDTFESSASVNTTTYQSAV